MFTAIWNDLSYAARSLARARTYSFVCIVSLGIGMVPVITIPYVARAFRTPPPGLNTDGLVELDTTPRGPREATDLWSYPDFIALREADTGMTLSAWIGGSPKVTLTTAAGVETQTAAAIYVSPNYFRMLGVPLAKGAGFDEKIDDTPAPKPEVIVGYDYWQKHLASDPDIVGKTITLDRVPYVVVGIAREHFAGHLGLHFREIFLPIERHPSLQDPQNPARTDRNKQWLLVHGRLLPNATLAQARTRVEAVTSELGRQFPSTNEFRAGTVVPYHPFGNLQKSDLMRIETVGLTLTGIVLMVVCLNLSGMMQVRSAIRERELSIRQAIGATRGRLMRNLLSEAIVLAGAAGTLASILLLNLPSVVAWLRGEPLPFEMQNALRLNVSTVATSVAICLLTSLVFGLLPATRFSRPVVITSLKDDAGAGGLRVGRVHRFTAALQVAIAVPLIVMSAMSLERFRTTATTDLGFASEVIYAAPLKFEKAPNATTALKIQTVRDNLAHADGVASATVADSLPLGFSGSSAKVALQADSSNVAPKIISAHVTRVGDDYLDAMQIPLVSGRGFTSEDRAGAEAVTIISKQLAETLRPDADAAELVGKRLLFGDDQKTPLTIVGVTSDFPTSQMSTRREQLLLPLAQHSSNSVFLIARSNAGEPSAKLSATLTNAVRDLGDDFSRDVSTPDGVPYANVVTGVWLRQNSMRDFLVQSAVAGTVGSAILLLAALGIYGVVGLMVATRTREIAVRTSLGATRRRVIRMILLDVAKLTLPGVAVGLVITFALVRVNGENMGIALSNKEPLAYVAGAAVAWLVALVASFVPARRAASVDPMVAMRAL